jgi:hypothetical protein
MTGVNVVVAADLADGDGDCTDNPMARPIPGAAGVVRGRTSAWLGVVSAVAAN